MEIDRPTGADYANANAEGARRAAEGSAKRNKELKQELEEKVVLLQGQVSFLAGMVINMNRSLARPAPEDMKMLERIRELGKD